MTDAAKNAEMLKDILTDAGFARRVDAELDMLGYPKLHILRIAAQARFKREETPND